MLQSGPLAPDHVNKLPYTKACLRETLRLYPPVAAIGVSYLGDAPTTLGNKWAIQPNDPCILLLPKLHQDPNIFGLDAAEFRPERMLEENFKKLPPNSFKVRKPYVVPQRSLADLRQALWPWNESVHWYVLSSG